MYEDSADSSPPCQKRRGRSLLGKKDKITKRRGF